MSWDMKPGMDQEEYFEFMMREFIPKITHLGLEPTDYWYTMYGEAAQFLTAATAIDLRQMNAILDSTDWFEIEERLHNYVINLDKKVVKATGGFQL